MADNTDPTLIPDLLFTDAAAVFQHVDQLTDISKGLIDSLIVGNVASVADFYWIESERDQLGRKSRLFYLPGQKCALVTTPTPAHEQAHTGLYSLVYSTLKKMGTSVTNEWNTIGGTTYRVDNGSGEADAAGGPGLMNGAANTPPWPTLVIETGFTQSADILRIKARWWFNASVGRVKTVLLVKFNVEDATIILEKWAKTPELTLQHTIDISWMGGPGLILETPKDERSKGFSIASNRPLIVKFEDLMGRPPVESDGETDVVITDKDLEEYAKSVWYEV
ncbi:hypothetical protein Sste5346_007452 [Sporothrix stenoceras]|uniref:Uncharacterized protein n=1 Tax=Sporothrix stenoceras TaxID=5173 RepID=A0ABR3YVA3_9PEZI